MGIACEFIRYLTGYRSISHPASWHQVHLLLRQLLHIPFLQTPALTLYAQSKECQKLHWNVAHKPVCGIQAEQHSRLLRKDPDEKAKARKLNRWINAWSLAMTACLPIALDIPNHQQGRHETHTYGHSPTSVVSF